MGVSGSADGPPQRTIGSRGLVFGLLEMAPQRRFRSMKTKLMLLICGLCLLVAITPDTGFARPLCANKSETGFEGGHEGGWRTRG